MYAQAMDADELKRGLAELRAQIARIEASGSQDKTDGSAPADAILEALKAEAEDMELALAARGAS